MKKADFHFELPDALIAQAPLPERAASRLLVLDAARDALRDAQFRELPSLLSPGDLLVFNDTRVLPARLFGRKHSGGEAEILIERVTGPHDALAQVRVSKAMKPGGVIVLADGTRVEVTGREGEFYALHFHGEELLETLLQRIGHMPLPPYIRRDDSTDDQSRYQTIYARETGAVAAPTAGLHFDETMLERLRAHGIEFGHVTLHVGAGTFQPMRGDDIATHVMHSERVQVSDALVAQVRRVRAAGGRIVAVGTTVVRALESASMCGELDAFHGETRIFIVPGHRFRSVDALLTNFHLPESTLLMLVSAFAGRERVLAAYRHAVAQRYRFFSYGDSMFIVPPSPGIPA